MDLYLGPRLYANQVQRYLDLFGSDHTKVLIFEEFIQNPRKAVGEVLQFLGVNAEPPDIVGKAYNSYTTPRWSWTGPILRSRLIRIPIRLVPARTRWIIIHDLLYRKADKPPLTERSRRFLEETFRKDVQTLEKILGRTLPWFHRSEPS